VQSIESQRGELAALFGAQQGIDIVDTLQEAQSAMTPGRPVFGQVIERIERGEADGLIAWAPDRLARNSVDGGRVIYLLDTGKLKDLKFATFTFENTPSGKFMLSILFGQSKYYSDALSENVKRGIRTKLQNGWLPGKAPIGYLNDPATHTIVPDPDRFPLIRELWELTLTGAHSPRQIREIMAERGLRTPPRKFEGGRPPSLSGIYNILRSAFYAGLIPWKGQLHPGKHQPVVSMDEWNAVQDRLGRPTQARPKEKTFAYTGLIKCGECGFSVTAEDKKDARYTYYHCSKRRLDYDCRQRSLEKTSLERQVAAFLERLTIPPELHEYALGLVSRSRNDARLLAETSVAAIQAALQRNDLSSRNLTKLRIAEQISESEFATERKELDRERLTLLDRQRRLGETDRLEPAELCVLFGIRAAIWFHEGDNATKRLILEIVGSNTTLFDQKLRINAAKLFRKWENVKTIPTLLGVVKDVRTFSADPDTIHRLEKLKVLIFRTEPDLFGSVP